MSSKRGKVRSVSKLIAQRQKNGGLNNGEMMDEDRPETQSEEEAEEEQQEEEDYNYDNSYEAGMSQERKRKPNNYWDRLKTHGKKKKKNDSSQATKSSTGDRTISSRDSSNEQLVNKSYKKGPPVATVVPNVSSMGYTHRALALENARLKRQLNGLCNVGVRDKTMATAVRKYTKDELFSKIKFVTHKDEQLENLMSRAVRYFNVTERDKLHWEQTYQHELCDAINQKRNHVAQTLRKVVLSK